MKPQLVSKFYHDAQTCSFISLLLRRKVTSPIDFLILKEYS